MISYQLISYLFPGLYLLEVAGCPPDQWLTRPLTPLEKRFIWAMGGEVEDTEEEE